MYIEEVSEQKKVRVTPEQTGQMLAAERNQEDDSTPIATFYAEESGMQMEGMEVTPRKEIKLKTRTNMQDHIQP